MSESATGASGGHQKAGAASPGSAPYAPKTAQLGGMPTIDLDVPICAVMLFVYLIAAATHMVIFQVNRKRDHKFIFSALIFGFCMSRIATLLLRIAWAISPHNVNMAIAANIFVQAGVLLLFVVNLIFAQRVVRSYHPKFGWSKGLGIGFKILYLCVLAMLIMVITAAVYNFFTLDTSIRAKLRIITLFAGTFLALMAFLPIPVTLLTLLFPRGVRRPEKFGHGRYRTKISLLLITSFLLAVGASFRLAVNFTTPRLLTNPAWYHSKACFYGFIFAIEIIVVYIYAIARFDRRFYVPDGSTAPGHYSGMRVLWAPPKRRSVRTSFDLSTNASQIEVNREVDVYGDDDDPYEQQRRESEWEARAIEELNKAASLESM